ncbi:MAG: transporter substrate-binding domain-containing protein [Desulfobacter sp.]|nr:MAG: transporter substrate-binding domain-containing protein [Desulfobacter sp.]
MKPGLKWMAVLAAAIVCWGQAVWAGALVWATDDTPDGRYVVGGGGAFAADKPGIEIELYRMVAEKLNLDVRFIRMPWNHCLRRLENNTVDGVFPASFKPERLKYGVFPMTSGRVDPSRRTRDNAYSLYKLKGNAIGWDGSELVNVTGKVGVPTGWRIAGEMIPRYNFIVEDTINANVPNLLVYGRLQGYICLETVFDVYLARRPAFYANIVKVRPPVSRNPYYLMLSNQFFSRHPGTAEKIWDTVRDIRRSPAYDALVSSYLD